MTRTIHFVFDQPPCPDGARFIECETPDGKSVDMGPWRERPDGFWELVVDDGRERIAQLGNLIREALVELRRDTLNRSPINEAEKVLMRAQVTE